MKVLFGGDVSFGRSDNGVAIDYSYSGCLSEFSLIERDYSIVNLETPICEGGTVEDEVTDYDRFRQKYFLCSNKKSLNHLKEANVDHVTRANNHCLDYGLEGLISTSQFLSSVGITWSGLKDPHIDHENKIIIFSTVFIGNYNSKYVSVHNQFEILFVELREEYSDYLIFICPHWGLEWYREPLPSHKKLARRWIDLGADGVVGNHPHVSQSYALYKNKPIFFSLGNLFFPHVGVKKEQIATQWSLAPVVSFEGRELISVDVHQILNSALRSDIGSAPIVDRLYKQEGFVKGFSTPPLKTHLDPMGEIKDFCRKHSISFKEDSYSLSFKEKYKIFYSSRGITMYRGGEVKAHYVSKDLEDFYFILLKEVK